MELLWGLKPNFRQTIMDIVKESAPNILIVTETKIGGDRAKEITDKLPFDGAIHTDTIGYAGGLGCSRTQLQLKLITLPLLNKKSMPQLRSVLLTYPGF